MILVLNTANTPYYKYYTNQSRQKIAKPNERVGNYMRADRSTRHDLIPIRPLELSTGIRGFILAKTILRRRGQYNIGSVAISMDEWPDDHTRAQPPILCRHLPKMMLRVALRGDDRILFFLDMWLENNTRAQTAKLCPSHRCITSSRCTQPRTRTPWALAVLTQPTRCR